jgi:hypothetical protein
MIVLARDKMRAKNIFIRLGVIVAVLVLHYLYALGVAYFHTKYKIIDRTRYDIISVKPRVVYWKHQKAFSYMTTTVTAKPPILGNEITLYYSFAGRYIDVINLSQFEASK